MSLASYTPESRGVEIGGVVKFHVTGLSLSHVEILIRTHLDDIEALFDLFMNEGGNFESDDLKRLGISLATNAPGFVANVIALAAGEQDATENAARLPLGTQLSTVSDVMELTFMEVGGIKKFMETVAGLLKSIRGKVPPKLKKAMETTSHPSSGSTEAFVAT